MAKELRVGPDDLLHKGTAIEFDEASEPLRAPAFLATHEAEASYYARKLAAEEGARRRVVTYRPTRELRFLLLDEDHATTLADVGIEAGPARAMAWAAGAKGYDGLALDGGESGQHVVLLDTALLRHVVTNAPEPDEAPSPRHC